MAVAREKTTESSEIVIGLPELNKGIKTSVFYNGLLKRQGAEQIFLHYGFDGWNNVSTVEMSETKDGAYTTKVKVEGNHELNFCFKDSADNWDNNYGANWKTEIIQ